jgi:hypothetical protein
MTWHLCGRLLYLLILFNIMNNYCFWMKKYLKLVGYKHVVNRDEMY